MLRVLAQSEFPEDSIEHKHQLFNKDADDDYWLAELAKRSPHWIILCGDTRISKSPTLQAAWLEAGLTTFFFWKGWMHIPLWEQASKLIKIWPDIRKSAGKADLGTGFKVPHDGKIEELAFLKAARSRRLLSVSKL